MEQFIIAAIEAFTTANGDVDKFELLLRRQLMSTPIAFTQDTNPMVNQDFEITPDMAEELANIDIDNMTDMEIIEYARKMGMVR